MNRSAGGRRKNLVGGDVEGRWRSSTRGTEGACPLRDAGTRERRADAPPQFDKVEQVLDSLVMREALDTLSLAHRQVIGLAHGQDLTQSQIAEKLGLPLGTVKTRMFHAMRALRAAPGERGFHAAA